MNPNSCEALPGNYRQTREIDFVNLSRENIIGLLLTLALLVGPVLLAIPLPCFLPPKIPSFP